MVPCSPERLAAPSPNLGAMKGFSRWTSSSEGLIGAVQEVLGNIEKTERRGASAGVPWGLGALGELLAGNTRKFTVRRLFLRTQPHFTSGGMFTEYKSLGRDHKLIGQAYQRAFDGKPLSGSQSNYLVCLAGHSSRGEAKCEVRGIRTHKQMVPLCLWVVARGEWMNRR